MNAVNNFTRRDFSDLRQWIIVRNILVTVIEMFKMFHIGQYVYSFLKQTNILDYPL